MRVHMAAVRLLGLLAVVGVLAAACGGDGDSRDSAVDTPASADQETPETETATAVAAVDVEAWAGEVTAAWDAWNVARSRAATSALGAMDIGVDFFDWTQEFLATEGNGLATLLSALPEPLGTDLDADYEALVAVVAEMRAANTAAFELSVADPDAVRADLELVGDDLPDSEYGRAWIAYSDFDAPLDDACFSVQQAMAEEGLPLLDCTASNPPSDAEIEDLAGDDPTTEPTGVLTLLPAGDHDFTVFGPGLLVSTERDVEVTTSAEVVVFNEEDAGQVYVIDARRVVDPDNVSEDPAGSGYIDRPDDLGPWVEALPVDVLETGTLDIAVGTATFWNVTLSQEALERGMFLGYTYFNGDIEAGESASMVATPPEPGVVTTLVDWHRGDHRLLISWEAWQQFDGEALGLEIVAAIRG